jgi:hypothetical protein
MSDVRYGVHPHLEAAANELIYESLRGVTSQAAKGDILTPWKEADRRSKEIMSSSGVVDPAIRRGIYGRAANTVQSHLNSREGVAGYGVARIPNIMEDDWSTFQGGAGGML